MISVIIPSYNHEKYIGRCIESVLNQTCEDFELIVIDDGSVDSSNQIISSYKDARLYHLSQANAGAHNTINRGLKLASGNYLTILNSDDEFCPTRLERIVAEFEQKPDVDLISTWIEVIDAEGEVLGIKKAWHNMEPWQFRNKSLTYAATNDYALNALMANFVSTTSNMAFRRSLYDRVGGMRELRFAHDWDFLLRSCATGLCENIDLPLMRYRLHGSNTISSNRRWMLFEVCWVVAANIDKFAEKIMPFSSECSIESSSLKILESFNFQGNDHIFWLLYWQFNRMKSIGIINPEEIYLTDATLRNAVIQYVKDTI